MQAAQINYNTRQWSIGIIMLVAAGALLYVTPRSSFYATFGLFSIIFLCYLNLVLKSEKSTERKPGP